MSVEVKVQVKPTSGQLRKAVLIGVATAIIEETKKAFEARSRQEDYLDSPKWPANSEEWTARKVRAGESDLIGVQTGELREEVNALTYEVYGTTVKVSIFNEHADFFDAKRPTLYVPPNDVIRQYIAKAIREASRGS